MCGLQRAAFMTNLFEEKKRYSSFFGIARGVRQSADLSGRPSCSRDRGRLVRPSTRWTNRPSAVSTDAIKGPWLSLSRDTRSRTHGLVGRGEDLGLGSAAPDQARRQFYRELVQGRSRVLLPGPSPGAFPPDGVTLIEEGSACSAGFSGVLGRLACIAWSCETFTQQTTSTIATTPRLSVHCREARRCRKTRLHPSKKPGRLNG